MPTCHACQKSDGTLISFPLATCVVILSALFLSVGFLHSIQFLRTLIRYSALLFTAHFKTHEFAEAVCSSLHKLEIQAGFKF